MHVAGVPPARILIFGHSLGTAVGLAIAARYAARSPPVAFAGMVLVAPFADVATCMATYRVAGWIPIVSPLARFPLIFNFLRPFIVDEWASTKRIEEYIRSNESDGQHWKLTVIHAEDDYDVPWSHTETICQCALKAMTSDKGSPREVGPSLSGDIGGAAGSVREWRTKHGVLKKEILKVGLHDVVMRDLVVTLAVKRIFGDTGRLL